MLSFLILLAAVNVVFAFPHDSQGVMSDAERDFNATLIQPRATNVAPGSSSDFFLGRNCRTSTCTRSFSSTTPLTVQCYIKNPWCSWFSSSFLTINDVSVCDNSWVVMENQDSITLKIRTSGWTFRFASCSVFAQATTATTTAPTTSGTTTTATTTAATTTAATTTAATTTVATTTTSSARCVCGKLNRGNRIVGGTQAQAHEYPYQVGLKSSPRSTQIYCGGSIISTEWIITAAHCTRGTAASSIYVTVGEQNRATTTETDVTQTIQVSMKVEHPDYNTNTLANDISLLRLSQSLTFESDNKIAPICMPELTGPPVGTPLIVTGWGTTSSGGNQPNALREVTVFSVSQSVCNNVYGTITSSQICAADTGKDSCQGDSGGPLVALNGNNYELTGVVSFGNGCALQGFPGVYAKVNSYVPWITSVTGTLDTCPKA